MNRIFTLSILIIASALILASCAGGNKPETDGTEKGSELREALETTAPEKPAGKDNGMFNLEEAPLNESGDTATKKEPAHEEQTKETDQDRQEPAPQQKQSEERGETEEYGVLPDAVKLLANKICDSATSGDALQLMNLTHPKVFAIKKKFIEQSEEGGWENYVEQARTQGSQNPAESCTVHGYREYECTERYSATMKNLGVELEKCGELKIETVFSGEKHVDQSRVIRAGGKWYFAGN